MKLQTFFSKQKKPLSILVKSLISKYKVYGHSMEPLILNSETAFTSKIPYWFNTPKINDIVAFENENKVLLKRIIKINKGKYFVQGDNRNDSFDSRAFGEISNKQILGKVIYVLK